MKITALQTVDPSHWKDLTIDNHLAQLGMLKPQLISPLIDLQYAMNIGGDDIVNFANKFPEFQVESEATPFEWLMQGSDEWNVPLIGAFQSDLSTSYSTGAAIQAGINLSIFYMVFPERFGPTSVLVGPRPDIYHLRVVSDPISVGQNWAHPVQLMGNDINLSVPPDVLAVGTTWMSDYPIVEQTLSKRGNTVHHVSPYRFRNTLSMLRKGIEVPGNMIRMGTKNEPLAFAWTDQNGKTQTAWIDKLGWDFYVQSRRDIARLSVYGKSNMFPDGTYKHIGESGFTLRQGHGLYSQLAPSNTEYYNTFDIDQLVDYALGLSYNKLPEDKRRFVLSSGEYGIIQFNRAMEDKVAQVHFVDQQMRIMKKGDEMTFSGVFTGYKTVRGIEFFLMWDPMKDNITRFANHMHPEGGTIASREYDLWDFGTANGSPNIQRITLKGQLEVWRYYPGLRDPFSGTFSQTRPGLAVSKVDGYEVEWGCWTGMLVRNAMRCGRYLPAISITG